MNSQSNPQPPVQSFEILKEIEISAPIEIAYEALLEQLGEQSQMPGGKPFPMKIELWPGGRWFRDLGDNTGHLWGHVQVIKPPALLEICGPLMMSFPATNHLQYRLKTEADKTRLSLNHRSVGLIPPEHRQGLDQGWGYWLERIRDLAQEKNHKGDKR